MSLLLVCLSMLFWPVNQHNKQVEEQTIVNTDTIRYEVFDSFEELEEKVINKKTDKTKVINFWATWCGPCIKELPYFEAINEESADNNLEVTLVSLDFKNQLKRRLDPYLEKNKIASDVVVLADSNPNKWIDMVDPSWSGVIPATLVVHGNKKLFVEKEFHSKEEIYEFIKKLK